MTTTEKPKLQEGIEKMAGDQFDQLKGMVDAEQKRRAGDADRAPRMNDHEFNTWANDQIAAGDKAKRNG